jgi:hypothetical protein
VQTAWGEIVRGLHRLHDERAFPASLRWHPSRALVRSRRTTVGTRRRSSLPSTICRRRTGQPSHSTTSSS